MYEFFQTVVGSGRIAVGAKIDQGSIDNHPDLPQVSLWMFDDPTCHLPHAAWWHYLYRLERLERIRVVFLGLESFLYLLYGLCERVRILRTWRVVPCFPESHDSIGDGHGTLGCEGILASDQHLGVLSKEKLGGTRTEFHFFDDRQYFLLSKTNVDSEFFWLHLNRSGFRRLPGYFGVERTSLLFLSPLHSRYASLPLENNGNASKDGFGF